MNSFIKNYKEAVEKLQLTLKAEIESLTKCITWSGLKDLVIEGQKKWEEAESNAQVSRMLAQAFILNQTDVAEFILIDVAHLRVHSLRTNYLGKLNEVLQEVTKEKA